MKSKLYGSYRCVRSETAQLFRFQTSALLIPSSVGNALGGFVGFSQYTAYF